MSNPVASEKTARHVQQLLVSEDGTEVRGLEACSFYQSLDATGGDFWLLEPLGKDDGLLVFGDVTGHGEAAGMVTAVAVGAVEMARLGMRDALRPFMLSNLISYTLIGCVNGEFLISGLVGRWEPACRTLHLVNAGHPPPRLVRDGKVEIVRGAGHPPLGSIRSHRYEETALVLEAGDLLVFFSDGFSEAVSSKGVELGERAIQQAIETYAEGGAPAIRNAIHAALLEHVDGHPLNDDLTLLILTVS